MIAVDEVERCRGGDQDRSRSFAGRFAVAPCGEAQGQGRPPGFHEQPSEARRGLQPRRLRFVNRRGLQTFRSGLQNPTGFDLVSLVGRVTAPSLRPRSGQALPDNTA